jgi:hypothetical protein
MRRDRIALSLAAGVLVTTAWTSQGVAQRNATGGPAPSAAPSVASTVGPPIAPPTGQSDLPFHLGVDVRPDTVAIGEPFVVTIRIRAPRGTTVAFPIGPDSATAVEALDPRTISTRSEPSAVEVTARYRLAAWDLGRQPIALTPVDVRIGEADRLVALGDLAITVRASAPADSGARIPKPARALFPERQPWWRAWAVAGIMLTGLLVAWLLGRWWRRRPPITEGPADPLAVALRAFSALDRLGLPDAGERGRYVALVIEIVRAYLARRLPAASVSHSSAEVLEMVRDDPRLPTERLRHLLLDSDLVKFARRQVSPDQAQTFAAEARTLVTEMDRQLRETPPTAPASPRSPTQRPSGPAPRPSGGRPRADGQAA